MHLSISSSFCVMFGLAAISQKLRHKGTDPCYLFFLLSLQYYMTYGENRYVDLGLQSHRVRCRVHRNFK